MPRMNLLALLLVLSVIPCLASASDDGLKTTTMQKAQCAANLSHKTDIQSLRDGDRCEAYVRALKEEMDGELAWSDNAHTMLVQGTWQDGVTVDQLVLVFVKYVNDSPAELNKPARDVFHRSAENAGLYTYAQVAMGK